MQNSTEASTNKLRKNLLDFYVNESMSIPNQPKARRNVLHTSIEASRMQDLGPRLDKLLANEKQTTPLKAKRDNQLSPLKIDARIKDAT